MTAKKPALDLIRGGRLRQARRGGRSKGRFDRGQKPLKRVAEKTKLCGKGRHKGRQHPHLVVDGDESALGLARGGVDGAMQIAQRTIEFSRPVAVKARIAVAVKQSRE